MFRYLAIVSTVFLLTACGYLEHKTPEARQQIKRDLNVAEITDTAVTSYCWLRIGGAARCKYTPGISVLTPDSLLLVDYEDGAYVKKDILKAEDVKCISDVDGQNFYVFKDQLAVSIIPYTEVYRSPPVNNPEYRAKVISMLLKNGQPYLSGTAATVTKATGKKQYDVYSVSAATGPVPIVVGTEVRELFSPCPAESR